MKNIKSFEKLFEAAPRIPRLNQKGLDYWQSKGKKGKDVMIYTHDDMDGIFSAVVVKNRMIDLGYNIIGYGILNYMEGWKNTSLDPEIINVAVDFASMPEPDRKDLIDIYIDHHGEFTEDEKDFYGKDPVIKTDTGSAYEGICNVIGKPADEIVLYSIDMIDSAKYDDYNVDWRDILYFDWDRFKKIASKPGKVEIKPFDGSKPVKLGWPIIAKLTFAGAFNQLLKRGDHKTVIEVIDNVKDVSIYGIYNAMKKLYPGNNHWPSFKGGGEKDFIQDRSGTINTMGNRTRGKYSETGTKDIIMSQQEYIEKTNKKPKGYVIINNLMFVPSGTWANALRARAILLEEMDAGRVPEDQVDFIMLQYGNTIQVCGFQKLEKMVDFPILNDGSEMRDLAQYMTRVLKNFQKYFGYYEPDTSIGQEELTVSGGHVGIGTISNIIGNVNADKIKGGTDPIAAKLMKKYNGMRFLDLFRNKIIADLSKLGDKLWPVGMPWPAGGDDDPIKTMIREIINKDPELQDRINKAKRYEKKAVREEIKMELEGMEKEEIKEWHKRLMMDHKVMKRRDIRQIPDTGKVPTRDEWEEISKGREFDEEEIDPETGDIIEKLTIKSFKDFK
jgi:hypothetical protein